MKSVDTDFLMQMPTNALVIGPLPQDMDDYPQEGGGKFLPGQVMASTVENVTIRFINHVTVGFLNDGSSLVGSFCLCTKGMIH